MNEFEKKFPDSKKNSGNQLVIARKEGWRMALKWVLDGCEHTGDCGESLINQYQIQEELENGRI